MAITSHRTQNRIETYFPKKLHLQIASKQKKNQIHYRISKLSRKNQQFLDFFDFFQTFFNQGVAYVSRFANKQACCLSMSPIAAADERQSLFSNNILALQTGITQYVPLLTLIF